jgi:hypothetical protein
MKMPVRTKTYHRNVWRALGYDKVRLPVTEFLTINRMISYGLRDNLTVDECVATIVKEMKEERAA